MRFSFLFAFIFAREKIFLALLLLLSFLSFLNFVLFFFFRLVIRGTLHCELPKPIETRKPKRLAFIDFGSGLACFPQLSSPTHE